MEYVIVGNGPAGVSCAETLRVSDPTATITLVGDEPGAPYARMALPYYLMGRISASGTRLRHADDHYEALEITCMEGRVNSVDRMIRRVSLASGAHLCYDKLLISTGSAPVLPPIAGIRSPRVFTCWTLDDARKIKAMLGSDQRIVLIGAGFIGCILLQSLVSRGAKLRVIESAPRMLPRMMDARGADLLRRWCESRGVEIALNTTVDAIETHDDGLTVTLGSGATLPCDLVIVAAGVTPNTEFLASSGVECNAGIVVNHYLQSDDPDIFAAGDVARGRDFSTGEYTVQAIQPTAVAHGALAALNMLGRKVRHSGELNMNVLDTLGLVTCSFGRWQGDPHGTHAQCCDPDRHRYLLLQFSENTLIGALAVGVPPHIGMLRGLIQGRLGLGVWQARLRVDPTRFAEAYTALSGAAGAGCG